MTVMENGAGTTLITRIRTGAAQTPKLPTTKSTSLQNIVTSNLTHQLGNAPQSVQADAASTRNPIQSNRYLQESRWNPIREKLDNK